MMTRYNTTNFPVAFFAVAITLLTGWAQSAYAQAPPISIDLSDPSQPMTLKVNILSAQIRVIGEKRDDVQIDVSGNSSGGRSIVTPSGVKKIDSDSYKLSATERNNTVNISSDWRMSAIGIVVRVPASASVDISTTNNSTIVIDGVTGEMRLQNVNGPITVTGAASSVIAESINRAIDIAFTSLSNVSAVSLTTMNGDLSVGLPERPAVQLHIDTSRGKIASDFEIDVQPSTPVVSRDEGKGKVEISIENMIIANINGGGPVIRLKTLNGDIQINRVP